MNHQKSFANIVLIVLVVALAGVVGYFALMKKTPEVAQQTNTPTPINTQSNKQTSPKPTPATTPTNAQRSEESFVFAGKRPSGSNADLYRGYVIVEGEYYEYYPETLGGGVLFFKVDSQYKTKLPKKYGEHSERFAFDNDSAAKQMLKVNESVLNNKSICKLSGRAKIAIEDYTVELLESAVWDHTKLVQVISSTTQTTETCSEPRETASRPEVIMQYIKSGREIKPPPSAPKIYIHSPIKSDVWKIGSKQVIKWSFGGDFQSLAYKSTGVIFTCGSANYYYELIKSFDKGVTEAPTSLEWTVPNRALDRSDCKIRIEYNTSNSSDFGGTYSPEVGYWSSSEQFIVTTPGTGSPNITIISPRSGEVINISQPYTIQWRRERLSRGVRIYVYRGNEVLGYLDKGPFTPLFDFSYVWDAGSLIKFGGSAVLKESLPPGGDYRLRIVTQDWTINGPPPEAGAFSEPLILTQ